jgi:nucleoside-diphosphate kinase
VTERTLVLVKPDGVQRLLTGRILARYEERGLRIVGLKLMQVERATAERHYAEHREKPFFGGLVDFITSRPLVALALEGPNAIQIVRDMNGKTKPFEAAPGTAMLYVLSSLALCIFAVFLGRMTTILVAGRRRWKR